MNAAYTLISVAKEDTDARQQVKDAGGRWNPLAQVWWVAGDRRDLPGKITLVFAAKKMAVVDAFPGKPVFDFRQNLLAGHWAGTPLTKVVKSITAESVTGVTL
jgi:hypothetical protein